MAPGLSSSTMALKFMSRNAAPAPPAPASAPAAAAAVSRGKGKERAAENPAVKVAKQPIKRESSADEQQSDEDEPGPSRRITQESSLMTFPALLYGSYDDGDEDEGERTMVPGRMSFAGAANTNDDGSNKKKKKSKDKSEKKHRAAREDEGVVTARDKSGKRKRADESEPAPVASTPEKKHKKKHKDRSVKEEADDVEMAVPPPKLETGKFARPAGFDGAKKTTSGESKESKKKKDKKDKSEGKSAKKDKKDKKSRRQGSGDDTVMGGHKWTKQGEARPWDDGKDSDSSDGELDAADL